MVCPCCISTCSGSCTSSSDCAPGCICQFGECVRCEGCFEPSNCTLTVTVTRGDGSTFTLTYPDDGGELFGFGFGTCSVSAFIGDLCGPYDENGNALGVASYRKAVELICDECCDDGTGKNCRLGAVISEEYINTCEGGGGVLAYTNFSFALNCDPAADPCNEFP